MDELIIVFFFLLVELSHKCLVFSGREENSVHVRNGRVGCAYIVKYVVWSGSHSISLLLVNKDQVMSTLWPDASVGVIDNLHFKWLGLILLLLKMQAIPSWLNLCVVSLPNIVLWV